MISFRKQDIEELNETLVLTKHRYEQRIADLEHENKLYSRKLEKFKNEFDTTFMKRMEHGVDYKTLFTYLVQAIKENFESPISLGTMQSPCILKSGQTIDEDELNELCKAKSKDPFDRTKIVDIKIPNLALINIMDSVCNIENLRKSMTRTCETSTQTNDDFHNKNDMRKIYSLENELSWTRMQLNEIKGKCK